MTYDLVLGPTVKHLTSHMTPNVKATLVGLVKNAKLYTLSIFPLLCMQYKILIEKNTKWHNRYVINRHITNIFFSVILCKFNNFLHLTLIQCIFSCLF